MQNRNKNSLTIEPNANLIAIENITVHVHQGNKVVNGKMHSKFFLKKYKYDINKQDKVSFSH